MKFLKWIVKVLKDLFAGPGNKYWDLGRIVSAFSVVTLIGATIWNMHLRQPIDIGPSGLGGGLAALLTAAGVLIAAKDISHQKALVEECEEPAP